MVAVVLVLGLVVLLCVLYVPDNPWMTACGVPLERDRWMTVAVGIGSVSSVPETMKGTARVACIVPSASCIDGVI